MGVVIKTMCDVLDRIEEKDRMEVAGYYTSINRDDRNIHTLSMKRITPITVAGSNKGG